MSTMSKTKQSGKGQIEPNPTSQPFLPDIQISLAGAGDLLHARFKVEEKMKRPGPIYVQDEKTGKRCNMAVAPKIGPLMGSRRKLGNYAFCIFHNTDFAVRPGSQVTFVSGEYRKEHIQAVI
jgi:hypothetical protein